MWKRGSFLVRDNILQTKRIISDTLRSWSFLFFSCGWKKKDAISFMNAVWLANFISAFFFPNKQLCWLSLSCWIKIRIVVGLCSIRSWYMLYIRDLKYCKKIYLSRDTAVRLRTEATAERTSAYLAVLQMVPASSHWMTKYCNTSSYIVTAPKKMYRYFDGNSQHQPKNKTTNGEEMMPKE